MADDEKTLKIQIQYDSGERQQSPPTPSQPSPSSLTPTREIAPVSPVQSPSQSSRIPIAGPSQLLLTDQRSRIIGATFTTNYPPPPTPPTPPTPPPPPTVGLPPTPPIPPASGGGPPSPPTPPTPRAPLPPAGAGGSAAASFLIGAGAVVTAFGAIVTTSGLLNAAFNRIIETVKELDPGIAQTVAISEIRTTLARMRQAQEIRGEASSFINEQQELREILIRLETNLVKLLTPLATNLLEFTQVMASVAEFASSLDNPEEMLLRVLKLALQETFPAFVIKKLLDKIDKRLDEIAAQELFDLDAASFQASILDALDPNRADILSEIGTQDTLNPRTGRRRRVDPRDPNSPFYVPPSPF